MCRIWDRSELVESQALALYFPGPGSFTGEDVVEFHVHGNPLIAREVMASLGRVPGLRVAEPGEFTRRSFQNGKMDLVQVEGLADLMQAETTAQRRQAVKQLDGEIGAVYRGWRDTLVRALAHLEAVIDFAEDEADVGEEWVVSRVLPQIHRVAAEVSSAVSDERRGELTRSGVRVAIVGPPNAGKSTLLNTFLQREAAITSDAPGTTRDAIEATMNLGGFPVVVTDTAGIRDETNDSIERVGIERSLESAARADLRLLTLDVASVSESEAAVSQSEAGVSDGSVMAWRDLARTCMEHGPTLAVLNKADTVELDAARDALLRVEACLKENSGNVSGSSSTDAFVISCRDSKGVDDLLQNVERRVQALLVPAAVDSVEKMGISGESKRVAADSAVVITRERHRSHLIDTSRALTACARCLDAEELVLAAEELRLAVQSLAAVLGRVDVEDVLDVLFTDFCIGK